MTSLMMMMTVMMMMMMMGTARGEEVVVVEGEQLRLECGLDTDEGGLLVWRRGDRVLAAGSLRSAVRLELEKTFAGGFKNLCKPTRLA